jgi:hypothetical protein
MTQEASPFVWKWTPALARTGDRTFDEFFKHGRTPFRNPPILSSYVADASALAEFTLIVFAQDGTLGRAMILATAPGVPVGTPLWQGPDIRRTDGRTGSDIAARSNRDGGSLAA